MTLDTQPSTDPTGTPADPYPENPVQVRVYRGSHVESQHRGAWCLVDTDGRVVAGDGAVSRPFFARSTLKSLQALPLLESGAASRFAFTEAELALALASHNAEPIHTLGVAGILDKLGLTDTALQCGAQTPGDSETRFEMRKRGERPTALHNNCSGKHAGFLALTRHLGGDPAEYLDPASETQRLVRQAILEMTGVTDEQLTCAVDGCSAPTYRMPLTGLATAFARVANPEALAAPRREACERMLDAVAQNPVHIAGRHKRLCTAIARVTKGRLFPKIGGEAVYGLGVRGEGVALAVTMDDGSLRGLHALIVRLLERYDLATPAELRELEVWREREIKNWAGLVVGRTEVSV